jgi:hypothetical protein
VLAPGRPAAGVQATSEESTMRVMGLVDDLATRRAWPERAASITP